MTRLLNSHIIITGGSEGIGAAFAQVAAAAGATVSLIARREGALALMAESIGSPAHWRAADVTDPVALAAAVAELEIESGPCDILVTCAGTALPGRFLDMPLEEFGSQVQLNYLGTVNALKIVLPRMVERGLGHIVVTSSTAGLIGVVGYSGYAPTKWAVRGLAETLRYEVEPKGIRVSVLYPPDTDTPGFAVENTRKPPETVAVSGSMKPVSAETVAIALARGIEANRFHIVADLFTRLLVRWSGLLEPILRGSFRRTIARSLAAEPPAPPVVTQNAGDSSR